MLLKLCLSICLLTATTVALASPDRAAKEQYCSAVAGNVQSGRDARKMNMDEKELQDRLFMYVYNLVANGMKPEEVEELATAVMEGYFNKTTPEKAFSACMQKENI